MSTDSALSALDAALDAIRPAAPPAPSARERPPAAGPSQALATRFAHAWLVLGGATVLLAAALAVGAGEERAAVLDAATARLRGQAHVVEQNLGQQLAGLDRALAALGAESAAIAATADAAAGRAGLAGKLRTLGEAIPGVRAIALLDAEGRVQLASLDAWRDRDFSQRVWFTTPRDAGDPTRLHASPPWRTSLGEWTMPFSRTVLGPGGRFAGVAVAALDPEYFETLLRSVLDAPDTQVAIVHGAGDAYVAEPPTVERGARIAVERRVAADRLRLDPAIVVRASRDETAVLAGWRRQTLERALALAAVAVASALVLRHAQRRRVAYAALEAGAAENLRRSADRLELATRAATLCLYDWDVVRDRYDELPVLVERLGYAPGEVGLAGSDWRALVHPADRGALVDAVAAHVRGVTDFLELEFRVRHRAGRWVWLLSRGRAAERDAEGRALRLVGTHLDTTARRRAETALERSSDMLRRTGELGRIGGWELEVETGELMWSEEVYRIHEVDPSVRPHLAMAIDFYDPLARERLEAAVRDAIELGTSWDLELPFRTARGNARWVRAQGVALQEGGRTVRLTGAFQDISERMTTALELQRLNAELVRLSTTDALTEVGNRRLFDQTLAAEWARASRRTDARGESIALVMVDIDRFKDFNDHAGHPAGDAVLRRVAALLGEAARRGGELVARYGGEEFAILLPRADLAAAFAIAERCRALLADARIPHPASPDAPWVTLSIGVAAAVPDGAADAAGLVQAADAALYRAKRAGRDRIER